MGLSSMGLQLLGGVALLLATGCSGSSSHSLRYFYTALSQPVQGLPRFITVGYVDDQPFTKYDSDTKRVLPQVPWIEKARKEDPDYWERNTQNLQSSERVFRDSLEILRDRYNQSRGGFHVLQGMYGCEVGPDGQLSQANMQDAYDGEDFLALDRKTLTWTARTPQAQETKRRWETKVHNAQQYKDYLEGTCVEWLRRYLGYGNQTLLRTEAPMTRVSRKKGHDGRETLFCQLYGFYPKEIEVTWMKDGEVWHQDTFTGGVVPNSDGTYHTWLSIDVDPKEKDRYQCRVGHDSLLEPLNLAWEEPASSSGLIAGVVVGVLAAILLGAVGVAFYMRKRSQPVGGYKATPASSLGLIDRVVVVAVIAAILLGAVGIAFYMMQRSQPVGGYKATPDVPANLGLLPPRSSSSHSLRYFYTALSEPSQGLPQFIAVGYVGDQPIDRYDSITKRDIPQAPWMEQAGKEDPHYWERNTQNLQSSERVFRADLEILRGRYNQSRGGLHTVQWMVGCEVGPDLQFRGGHMQYAYDGEDFIALDMKTLTWTAPVPQAQETKRRWEAETQDAQYYKSYLEGTCVEWLRRYLGYGNKTLLRTERPTVRVARKKGHDDLETLVCELYGFYPKDIEVTWMKDGVDRMPETLTGGVSPNSDRTYHTWRSIKVDPKEKDHYQCRVGHDSLLEPLNLAWEEPASSWGLNLGIFGWALLAAILVGAVVGVAFCMRKWKEKGYEAAARSDQGSDTSTKDALPV